MEAGSHLYKVGIDTPRLLATSRAGTPLDRSFFAALTLVSVICRLRPPVRPSWRATSKPARVRSTISSLSISAKLAMTWKKNLPEAVPVSIESVRLLNCTPCFCRSPTRSTRCLTLLPADRASKPQGCLQHEGFRELERDRGVQPSSHSPGLRRSSYTRRFEEPRPAALGSDLESRHAHTQSASRCSLSRLSWATSLQAFSSRNSSLWSRTEHSI